MDVSKVYCVVGGKRHLQGESIVSAVEQSERKNPNSDYDQKHQ